MDYSEIFGEKFEEKEAVLKYTCGDAIRTSNIMDLDSERSILIEYRQLVREHVLAAVVSRLRSFLVVFLRTFIRIEGWLWTSMRTLMEVITHGEDRTRSM